MNLILDSDVLFEEALDLAPVSIYPRFEYSMRQVKRAGEVIAGDLVWSDETEEDIREAFKVANNWRDAHAYPMRSVRSQLLWFMSKHEMSGISVARLKRMQAIRRKLRRVKWDLSKLQDLGGVEQFYQVWRTFGR
jgi:hypothetical protein